MTEPSKLRLRLYVSGTSPRGARAARSLRALCERHFPGRHQLSVIDVARFPALAALDGVHVTPTAVVDGAASPQRLVGDFTNPQQVLRALQKSGGTGSWDGLRSPASIALTNRGGRGISG